MAEEPKKINYGLPSNSNKDKEAAALPEKKIEKIVSEGAAVERKKPLGRRIAEMFTGDDTKTVANYILFEVIVPAAKAMIVDVVQEGLQRKLYGPDAPRSAGGSNGIRRAGYMATAYNKVGQAAAGSQRPALPSRSRNRDFKEIVVETRGEGEAVIDQLRTLIATYDSASVPDLYEMVGITGSFTDEKWGWFDLRSARVERLRDGGYLLNLPNPEPLT